MSNLKKTEPLGALINSLVEKPTKGKKISLEIADMNKSEEKTSLRKSFLNVLNGDGQTIERLAFEQDPDVNQDYLSIYKPKLKLLPDDLLKRIVIQDDLVASIVQARAAMISSFGRPQPDRFSTGYKIEPEPSLMERLNDDQKKALQKRIATAEALLLTCGKTGGWDDYKSMDLSQFLYITTRDAATFGRFATEILRTGTSEESKKFHSFRPIDAGTIYFASNSEEQVESVRKDAFKILQRLKNKKLTPEKFLNNKYTWVQVIHGVPRQGFTSDECIVHNCYPTSNIELSGYPLTPLDTVISAVTTHLNITTHNKLYFQNGRAAHGMLVIRSDDIDKQTVMAIRQQFNASINNVSNAFRMPIFGVGTDDEIVWQPIDNSSRDMEFQYLSDSNARTILSAFQMSPDELPGYSHLSRGTNSQSLSESNNEYKLSAARDVGLRPLLGHFQNFINQRILPLIDEELSKLCSFKFVGLDAETSEKEAARLGAEVNLHMTMDNILESVQKKPVGTHLGGKFPLNPTWQNAMAPYLHVGYIREHFFGVEGASKDPEFAYVRDPMWFQWQQLQMQAQQMQQQAQAQQQGPQQPQEQSDQQNPQQTQKTEDTDLTRTIDQAAALLAKGETQLSHGQKELVEQQKKTIQHFLDGWNADAEEVKAEILAAVKKPKKNG